MKKLKPLPKPTTPEKPVPKLDGNKEKDTENNTAKVLMLLASPENNKTASNSSEIQTLELDPIKLEKISQSKKEWEEKERIVKAVESITDSAGPEQQVYQYSSTYPAAMAPVLPITTFTPTPPSNIDMLCQAAQITPGNLQEISKTVSVANVCNSVVVKSEGDEALVLQTNSESSLISNQIASILSGGEVSGETVTYTVEHSRPDGRKFFIQIPAAASWSDEEITNIVSQVLKNEQKNDSKD